MKQRMGEQRKRKDGKKREREKKDSEEDTNSLGSAGRATDHRTLLLQNILMISY